MRYCEHLQLASALTYTFPTNVVAALRCKRHRRCNVIATFKVFASPQQQTYDTTYLESYAPIDQADGTSVWIKHIRHRQINNQLRRNPLKS